ncbi:MAG: NAD-dependent epimerase/dehydratase family protein, partial [Halioglobus sp.]
MKNVYIAGHQGMVGSAIARQLEHLEDVNLILRKRSELDLANQAAVHDFFEEQKIDEVYLAAAKVGG